MGNDPGASTKRLRLPSDDPALLERLSRLDEEQIRQLSDTEVLRLCSQLAPQAGTIVKHAAPVQWIIPGIIPAGSLILLAGNPKVARKSLWLLHLARVVSDPQASELFLGAFDVHRTGMTVVINLEDGRDRLIRRLAHFGIKDGDPRPLHVMWRQEGMPVVHEWLRRSSSPPVLICVDPFVELGVDLDNFDENASRDVAALMKIYRDIAQATGACVLLVHHFRKDGDRMRGSSALEGACDGWINIQPLGGDKLRMQIELRDAAASEVDYEIRYADDTITVEASSELREGHTRVTKRKEEKAKEDDAAESRAELARVIDRVLDIAEKPISPAEIAKRAGKRAHAVRAYLKQRVSDGYVARTGTEARPLLVNRDRLDHFNIGPERLLPDPDAEQSDSGSDEFLL